MPFINISIDPPVIAHRGASLYAPENTLAAFRKAKSLGVNWVEFDVMLTADGEVVVIHDETLDRTTDGKGQVNQFPYRYINTLDAGAWFNPEFAGEKIPTLREVIALLNQLQLSANIEIKAQSGQEELTVKNVLKIIKECWRNNFSQPLISSFSLPILKEVRKNSSTSLLGLLMDDWSDDWEKISERLQCVSIDVNYKILDLEKVKKIKATQRTLLAYTVNDPNIARELFSWGVDAVFSDLPEEMLPILTRI